MNNKQILIDEANQQIIDAWERVNQMQKDFLQGKFVVGIKMEDVRDIVFSRPEIDEILKEFIQTEGSTNKFFDEIKNAARILAFDFILGNEHLPYAIFTIEELDEFIEQIKKDGF
jgi:hypothetical protein